MPNNIYKYVHPYIVVMNHRINQKPVRTIILQHHVNIRFDVHRTYAGMHWNLSKK